jgi:hypothetical protein
MVSRKTYFGIGLPKDLIDPVQVPQGGRDPEDDSTPSAGDHSAPTVIDDEKVAEGLAQLRNWYQNDKPEGAGRPVTSGPAQPHPVPAGQRPTAVGHASSDLPMAPRQFAPDPMRATMFGHDIHRIDFGSLPSAADLPPAVNPSPPGDARSAHGGAIPADPPPRPQAATPRPSASGTTPESDAFRFADYLQHQAAQPHSPAVWVSSPDDTQVRAQRRTPIIVLAVGLAALALAVALAVQTKDRPNPPSAPFPAGPSTGIEQLPGTGAPAATLPERSQQVVPAPAPLRPPSKPAEKSASDRAALKPGLDQVAPIAPMKARKHRPATVRDYTPSETNEGAPAADESAGQSGVSGSASTNGTSESAAATGDVERAPAPKVQPVRPARSTGRARDKAAPLGDVDATLPPSTD